MMRAFKVFVASAATAGLLLVAGLSLARNKGDGLERGFKNPPDAARPRVWWHWTGGNVTREGITKDLEWMQRAGIGGAHMADIGMEGGQVVEDKIEFFTPEWFDAVKHAAAESDRLGLELSIFSSSGWSLTGGPWVKPEQAMKKLVWSETGVEGPMALQRKLPQPPSQPGAFGSLRGLGSDRGGGEKPPDSFYRDSAVIAFRTPPDETWIEDLKPRVTASGGVIDPRLLMDDDPETVAAIVSGPDGDAWVQYEFAQPVRIKAVTLLAPGRGVPFGRIEKSDDGRTFSTVVALPGAVQYRAKGLKTYAFPETTARFIRV
ncbi:MAG: glycoside hydrolase, partial [Acidobacteria bacterium]|nr:glycoside hydrolase [Acidobacteriota bacterium]